MSNNSLAASKSSARVGRTSSLTKDGQNNLLKSFSVLVSAIDDDASDDASSSSVEEHAVAASDFEASTSTRNFSNKPKRGALHVGELVKHKTAIAQAQKDQQDKKAPIESTAAKTIDRLTTELNQTKKHLDETEEELHTTRETNRKLKRMTGELEDDLSSARSETEALRRLMNMSNGGSSIASPPPTGQKASLIKKKALAAIEWSEGYNRDTIIAFESELRGTAVSYYATRFNSIVRVQRLQTQIGGGGSSNTNSSPLIPAVVGKDAINESTTTVTSDGTDYHLPNETFPIPEAAPEFDMPSISPRTHQHQPLAARKTGIWWPIGVPNTHYRDPKFIEVPSKGRARSKPPLTQDRSESSISPPPPSPRQHLPHGMESTLGTSRSVGVGVSTNYSPIRHSSTSAPRPITSSSRNTTLNATLLIPPSSMAGTITHPRHQQSQHHHDGDTLGNTVGSPSPRKVRSSQPSQRESAVTTSQRLGSGNPLPRAISPAVYPQRRRVIPPPSEVTIAVPAAPTTTPSETTGYDADGTYFKEVKQIRVSQRYPLRSNSAGPSDNTSRRGSVSSVLHVVTENGVRCASVPCFSRTESPAADHHYNQAGGRSASQQSHHTTASGPPPVVFDYLSRAHVLDEDALIRHQRQLLNIKRRPSDFNSASSVPVVSTTRPRASSASDAQSRFNLSPSLLPLRQQEIGGVVRVSSNNHIAAGFGDGVRGRGDVVRRTSSITAPAGAFQQVSSVQCSLKLDPPSHSYRQ